MHQVSIAVLLGLLLLGSAAYCGDEQAAPREAAGSRAVTCEVNQPMHVQFTKLLPAEYDCTCTTSTLPSGLVFGIESDNSRYYIGGTPAEIGYYQVQGKYTKRADGTTGNWLVRLTVTRAYTATTGTFKIAETAKEDADGYIVGTTKITATITLQGSLESTDHISMSAGGVYFDVALSGTGFTGKTGSFTTSDGAKVKLKLKGSVLTVTLSQRYNDMADEGAVSDSAAIAADYLDEDTGYRTATLPVIITAGEYKASVQVTCSIKIVTKTTTSTVTAKG